MLGDVQNRVTWFLAFLASGLLLTVLQLYRLTGPESRAWSMQAEQNMRREMPSHGPRGAIYDRKGRSLATSEPAFAAVLINQDPAYVEQLLPKLSLLLASGDHQRAGEIAEGVRRRVKEHKELGRQYEPVTIARKLDKRVVSTLIERRSEFVGVLLVTESARNYPANKLGGALLGYVGVISPEQVKEGKFEGYNGDEIVGKDGIELFYERELQGKPGKRSVIVDPWGRPMSDFEDTPPIPGNNLYLTLDLDLQRTAEEALVLQMDWIKRQHDQEANPIRGALVVQDVRTGAILAMASVPTFDPNLFVSPMTDAQWQELIAHPARPLQNWAIAGYSPGSIYKMGVGLAGLEMGVLGPYQRIDCPSVYWRYHKPRNWTPYSQGYADVARALSISCDPFFYEVGHLLGIDRMASFLEQFGFGKVTGIDVPGEQPGLLPTEKSYGDRWEPGNVLSVAIGQGDVLTTPLQLANYTATIASNGLRYRPYLISEIRTPAGEVLTHREPEVVDRVRASAEGMARTRQGMRMAVTTPEGTAFRPFQGFPVQVAAKTGSAETGNRWSNALTVAYAPYENPEIAISVLVEGGAHGSWVAPAARAVMAKYFGLAEKHDPSVAIKAD